MLNSLTPRLLSWGMTFSGLGFGLIVAAFVGEDTPSLALLGLGSLGGGATMLAARFLIGRKSSEQ